MAAHTSLRTMADEDVAEDVELMVASGALPTEAARRLGTTVAALDARLRRMGRQDLALHFQRPQYRSAGPRGGDWSPR